MKYIWETEAAIFAWKITLTINRLWKLSTFHMAGDLSLAATVWSQHHANGTTVWCHLVTFGASASYSTYIATLILNRSPFHDSNVNIFTYIFIFPLVYIVCLLTDYLLLLIDASFLFRCPVSCRNTSKCPHCGTNKGLRFTSRYNLDMRCILMQGVKVVYDSHQVLMSLY